MTAHVRTLQQPLVDAGFSWAERNQQWLVAAIARLRERIEAKLGNGTAASTVED